MVKKIFDILPPTPEERKPLLSKKVNLPIFFEKKRWKIRWGIIPLILILVGIFCYFILPYWWAEAEIEVWPKTEPYSLKTKITADINFQEIDLFNKIVPAKIFESEKIISEEFPSSGKELLEKKAEGIIRVYNNYSTQNQVLVANTRFVSAEGKLFRSIEKAIIPGGKYEEGKFIPGYLDIKVSADKPGEEYNIGPTTFSIPGFAGTPLYTKFYGKSFQPMKGGEVKEVSIVSQKDIEEAQKVLTEKIKEEVKLVLKEKIPSEFDLLKESQETKILEITPLAQPGQQLEKFKFQVKAKVKALAFKPEDIKNFLINFIPSQIPSEKKVLPESLEISYFPQNINLEEGQILLSLEAKIKIFSEIDAVSVKKGLTGKSIAETKFFLENQPEINRAEVKLWPFWLKRIPEDLRKIKIKLNFDID